MMPCYTPLKGYAKIGGGWTSDASISFGTKMEVHCGQCLGCRLDHARMWAMRIQHEASLFNDDNGSCFITLTYDDEHLKDWSLCKKDFQDFMKRLRERIRLAGGHRVRFFMCGEYGIICRHKLATEDNEWGLDICPGCNYGRPHFHAILFNCNFGEVIDGREVDLTLVRQDGDIKLYESKVLTKDWGNGFASVGEVTIESAGYVARYAVKKITGKKQVDHYISWNDHAGVWEYIEPEFSTQSNRPGIGADWFAKFSSDVFPSDEVPVPGVGVVKSVPGYYEKLFVRDWTVKIDGWEIKIVGKTRDQLMVEECKKLRLKYLRANKEEFTPERLMDKYKVKKRQVQSLKRKIS